MTVTTISEISVRSISLRSRSVVVSAAHKPREILGDLCQRLALSARERLWPTALELRRACAARAPARRAFPRGDPRACGRPAGSPARTRRTGVARDGLELGALDREPLARQPFLVRLFELVDRFRGNADPGRRDRLQERRRDRLAQAARRRATGRHEQRRAGDARARMHIEARGRSCPNRRPASVARSARIAPAPAAARLPSRAAPPPSPRRITFARSVAAGQILLPGRHSRDGGREVQTDHCSNGTCTRAPTHPSVISEVASRCGFGHTRTRRHTPGWSGSRAPPHSSGATHRTRRWPTVRRGSR